MASSLHAGCGKTGGFDCLLEETPLRSIARSAKAKPLAIFPAGLWGSPVTKTDRAAYNEPTCPSDRGSMTPGKSASSTATRVRPTTSWSVVFLLV